MKSKVMSVLAMLSRMLAVGTAFAQAQDKVTGTIPFQFNVGSKTLPAGEYVIRRFDAATVLILNRDSNEAAVAIWSNTESHARAGASLLVFNRYGHHYFLAQVWTPESARRLSKSKFELEVASEAATEAKNGADPAVVYVAAKSLR